MLNWQKALTNLIYDWLDRNASSDAVRRVPEVADQISVCVFGRQANQNCRSRSSRDSNLARRTPDRDCVHCCSLCWIVVVTQSSEKILVAKKPMLIFSNLANSCFALFEQTLSSDWRTHFSLRSYERLQKWLNQAKTWRPGPSVRFWTNLEIWNSTLNWFD